LSDITITRTNIALPAEAELEVVRTVLFKCIKGTTERENKAWRRWWKRVINFDAGEISFLKFIIPRNGKFHRKFFALLQVGFDAWEPDRKRYSYKGIPIQKDFEQFREDVIIASGNYIQTFNLEGHMKMRAKSISFTSMDDAEFSELYESVLTVILNKICVNYKNREELNSVVEKILGFAS